jgi:replicative DNA helicase
VSTQIIQDSYDETTDVFNLLDEAEKNLFSITEQNLSRGVENLGSLTTKALKQLEELKDKPDGLTGIPSGFHPPRPPHGRLAALRPHHPGRPPRYG